MKQEQDFTLPALNPFLKLYKAATADGQPSWTLHNPVANTYYKIEWAEFECLARFPAVKTAVELKRAVEAETTLSVDLSEIHELAIFLQSNGLLAFNPQSAVFKDKTEPLWKKILHSYLYFTIPLFAPEKFLKDTLPYVRPLLSRGFITIMLGLLSVAAMLTLPRIDEFFHSFSQFLSLEGVIRGLIVLALIKVVHELAHAYTATKYGVAVPHIGFAVIVLYPVLYTETTGSWQLSSRKQRFHIGMAGILAELCLAAVFLLLWNMAPAGSQLQGISFTVVTISLVGSLLINLNPLMRFDGYYMMSDASGIENLQQRSLMFARRQIRKILFNLNEEVPEHLPPEKQNFLTAFGLALLVYRFFLFTGIAVLVYHMFFKPLGLFLFLVEIGWFVVLPIWSEIKIWWLRRKEISRTRRTKIFAVLICIFSLFLILPWQRTVSLPGVLHSARYAALYPFTPSYIEEIFVHEGEFVREGDVLARLSSLELGKKLETTKLKLESMQRLQRRIQTSPVLLQQKYANLDLEIEKTSQELVGLQAQEKNLTIIAPFSGLIRDMTPEIKAGRYVQRTDLLFRVIEPAKNIVTGYVTENELTRIAAGDAAEFIPEGSPFSSIPLKVQDIASTDTDQLLWPEVSSFYKGPLASEYDKNSGKILPVASVFTVDLQLQPEAKNVPDMVLLGEIRVRGRASSPIINFFKHLGGLIVRETGFN